MWRGTRHIVPRAVVLAAGAIFLFSTTGPVRAAEYPRRIAITPFSLLTQDDVRQTVSILPRLLSSRLMALAGAEVVLLPEGKGSPEEMARKAGVPLLLQGSVSKLGKGYSIDTTVTDLSTGKSAGAFFAAANTEDDIIPELGTLAGDIVEKLFGVKPPVRMVQQPMAQVPSGYVPAPGQPLPYPYPGQPGAALPPPVPKGPETLADGWVPAAFKKISQSDKIPDELYGVVTGDADDDGNGEVIAFGKRTLYIYRVKGTDVLPYLRVPRGMEHHFLNVEAIDIDGDGKKEIIVTDLVSETLESFILKRKGDTYEEVARKIPYFLVVLPDWNGKRTLVGQYRGFDTPYQGKFLTLKWDGKTLVEGEKLPANINVPPLSSGILGLSSARFGKEWRLLYTDESNYLRVLEPSGKNIYKSRRKFGSATADLFEWGPFRKGDGTKPQFFIRKAPRVAPGGGDAPLVLVSEVEAGIMSRAASTFDTTRLALLQWEGGEFLEKVTATKSDYYYAGMDFVTSSAFRKGGRVVASIVEQFGSAIKEQASRLVVFAVE